MNKLCWVCVLPVLTLVGCGADGLEGASLAPNRSVAQALGVEPSSVRCEPLSPEALLAPRPPRPVPGPAASEKHTAALCPEGYTPKRLVPETFPPRVERRLDRALTADSGGVYYWAGLQKATNSTYRYGTGGQILINNPTLNYSGDQVTAELSIVQGANHALVETGYHHFQTPYSTLLIGIWVNGVFQNTTGFVQTHATYHPGMSLSAYDNLLEYFYVEQYQGNWWVWFNDGWVGYVPNSVWSGTFTYGDVSHWYGEVYSALNNIPPLTDMGNGFLADCSGRHATADMVNLCWYANDGTCYLMGGTTTTTDTNPSYYGLCYGTYPNSFHFGGPGGG
jgi:hypothetical protein